MDTDFSNGASLKVIMGHLAEAEEISLGTGQFLKIIEDSDTLKTQYIQPLGAQHIVSIGTEHNRTTVNYKFDMKIEPCGDFQAECFPDVEDRVQDADTLKVNSQAIYVEDKWQLHEDVLATVDVNVSDDDYLKEKFTEPRASIRWAYLPGWAVKVASGEYHRSPDGEQTLRDIGNPNLRNFKAQHYVLGLEHDDPSSWDWSLELYYKEMYDLALALSADQADAELNYVNEAEGEAYGVEWMIEKHLTDRWYG